MRGLKRGVARGGSLCYHGAMKDSLGQQLVQIARGIRRNFDTRARAIGVTRAQWQVLALLKDHQGLNQRAMADLAEVEPITMARMVDRLAEADLVERRADPADRRAWRIYTTAQGQALLERLRPYGEATLAEALEGLSAEEVAQLGALLARVHANLAPQEDM